MRSSEGQREREGGNVKTQPEVDVANPEGGATTTPAAQRLRDRLRIGLTIDVRGHGKAGGGLILAMQSFGAAIAMEGKMDVQDWPLSRDRPLVQRSATHCKAQSRSSRPPMRS
jgi:hypothetical protein